MANFRISDGLRYHTVYLCPVDVAVISITQSQQANQLLRSVVSPIVIEWHPKRVAYLYYNEQ